MKVATETWLWSIVVTTLPTPHHFETASIRIHLSVTSAIFSAAAGRSWAARVVRPAR